MNIHILTDIKNKRVSWWEREREWVSAKESEMSWMNVIAANQLSQSSPRAFMFVMRSICFVRKQIDTILSSIYYTHTFCYRRSVRIFLSSVLFRCSLSLCLSLCRHIVFVGPVSFANFVILFTVVAVVDVYILVTATAAAIAACAALSRNILKNAPHHAYILDVCAAKST